jgi:transposase InsO family protein
MTTPRKVAEKNAKNKLTLIELAERLKSVAAACRQMNYSRSQFYELKKRFDLEGFQGLIDRPPVPKSHPRRKQPEVVEQILEVTRQQPAWGAQRVAAQLRLQGETVCATSVYNLWRKKGLNRRTARWLWATQQDPGMVLTEQQLKDLEKLNPCLKERHVESPHPGYLLCQDTFYVGCLKGVGRLYLQAAVDTYCSLAFAKLYTAKDALAAADLLHDRVVPFYQQQEVTIQHILTDNGREYCGRTWEHYYQVLLVLHGIKHRRTKVATPRTNGFVERFNRTVLEEFFQGLWRRKVYTSLEEVQQDLETWLDFYNTQRPHLGYRNQGQTPWGSFHKYLEQHLTDTLNQTQNCPESP